jgi:hypothetical protein
MFSLGRTILLVSIRTIEMMRDANLLEERVESLIFSTPVGLYDKNFFVKYPLNKLLKLLNFFKDIRLVL